MADLPPTLPYAAEALHADAVVSGALDAVGPGGASYFTGLQREEFRDWHATVGDWEIDR